MVVCCTLGDSLLESLAVFWAALSLIACRIRTICAPVREEKKTVDWESVKKKKNELEKCSDDDIHERFS